MDENKDPMFDNERDEELAALVMLDEEAEEYVEHEQNDEVDEEAEAIWDA